MHPSIRTITKTKRRTKMKKTHKEFLGILGWMGFGFLIVKLGEWLLPGLNPGVVLAFVLGAFVAFLALSVYGYILQRKSREMRQAAMDQFIADQKADQEKQARIDQEIIKQLRNEHELSGEEQDRRLRALEAALKHLRGK